MDERAIATQRIVFTGDMAFDCEFADAWKNGGCLKPEVEAFLREADAVVGNVECPLTDTGITTTTTLTHAADPRSAQYLKSLGIGIWNLANNHIMDCGKQGMMDTLQCAAQVGCQTIGVGETLTEARKPVIIGNTVKVGVLSVAKPWKQLIAGESQAGALTWDQTDAIRQTIDELKKQVRWVVIVAHGGREYSDIPYPKTRARYLQLLELGADIIVAHHPHVVQNYEKVGDKIIFYSLGNFIFDTKNQRRYLFTDKGVLLGLNFTEDACTFDSFAVQLNRETQTVEPGETPAIFCNIGAEDYERLWPLERRYHYPLDLVNFIRIGKRFKGLQTTQKLMIGAVRFWTWLPRHSLLWDRIGRWNKSPLVEVRQYIKQSKDSL